MRKHNISKQLALFLMAIAMGGTAFGQSAPTPSSRWDCGEYMWPEVPSPCPEVQIKQKHDHTALPLYRRNGWDTVVTCENRQIILSCTPNIPTQRFNGTYFVDQIPYAPADTTFALGTRMPIGTDDDFAPSATNIPYPFYFFGLRKNSFVLGANGLVTFNAAAAGQGCPWSYSASIPWTSSTTGAPSSLEIMRDAIYGIYEDTNPATTTGHSTTAWGIYYGVQGEYPCRKIICSWNNMAQYSCSSLFCTYQIVCYEGSNIIEVHVKQRPVCTGWNNGGSGIIGIQNATGLPQVSDGSDYNILAAANGKPAAFYPTGYNRTLQSHSNIAFRFTPDGLTTRNYGWYRISEYNDTTWLDTNHFVVQTLTRNDTLRDSEMFPGAMYDTIGYMTPMHDGAQYNDYPGRTLTKAFVSPKKPTRYVFYLNFRNANADWYHLADTVFIGVDTIDYVHLHKKNLEPERPRNPELLDICIGDTAKMRVDMNKLQVVTHEEWSIFRISNGDTIVLDTLIGNGNTALQNTYIDISRPRMQEAFRFVGNDTVVVDTLLFTLASLDTVGDTIRVRDVNIYSNHLPNTGLVLNKIDSIYLQVTADYASGCHSFDTMMIRVFPKFDITEKFAICRGDTLRWHNDNHVYREETNPANTFVVLHSQPGCDSIVRLQLKVLDVSFTTDHIEDCKPITWKNGKTYTTGNAATAERDTVVLQNIAGCDSIVQLDFVIHPLKAKLRSNVDHFTIDNLNAVLTDISTGGDSRVWRFPGGAQQTGQTAYYSIPAEMDGAQIVLIESSPYGCVDSTKIYIPLNKEHFWMPNAFTPDNMEGNRTFGSVSTKTLYQEMLIYNRRGELVFRCEGVDCAWDGKDLDGNPCIQGAYVYVIRYTNEYEPNDTKVLKGTVMLIR